MAELDGNETGRIDAGQGPMTTDVSHPLCHDNFGSGSIIESESRTTSLIQQAPRMVADGGFVWDLQDLDSSVI